MKRQLPLAHMMTSYYNPKRDLPKLYKGQIKSFRIAQQKTAPLKLGHVTTIQSAKFDRKVHIRVSGFSTFFISRGTGTLDHYFLFSSISRNFESFKIHDVILIFFYYKTDAWES